MTRPVHPWTLAAIAGVGLLAVPAPAPAQYANIPIGGGYNVYYSRVRQFSVPFMTPNGPANVYYRNAGFRPYRRTPVVTPYFGGGYMGGGFGTGGYNPVAAQRAAELAAAQRAGGQAYRAARGGIADQFAYERGARPAAKPDDLARAARLVDQDLLTADPAEIASGAALNGLLGAVEPLQAKPGKPVDSPLLGPDLASRVSFAGGPNADALNLLRAGRLKFPEPLRKSADLADWRAEAEDAYAAATRAAAEGKPTPPAVADRLAAAADSGRRRTGEMVRDLPFPQAAAVVGFFNRLSATAAALADPKAAGLYDRNWSILGLTVDELTAHMAKYDLTFAPADAEAYTTLHRGLVGYYLTLAQERK